MHAALSARAFPHQDRDTQHHRVFAVVLQDFALGHQLGLAVKIGRVRHVRGAIGRVRVAVEDHVGGDVQKARAQVGGELGQQAGQRDIDLFRELRIGLNAGRIGQCGTIDDHIGPDLQAERGDPVSVGAVDQLGAVDARRGGRIAL